MKITIEIDGATVPPFPNVQPAAGISSTMTPAVPAAQITTTSDTTGLSDLLAKAAQLGAQSAGPGPALPGAPTGAGPVVASVGGAWPRASAPSASAGSPPPYVFDPKGGFK
jgi:hypothetical protein